MQKKIIWWDGLAHLTFAAIKNNFMELNDFKELIRKEERNEKKVIPISP
jgi:transcriptional regulator NrdR family protein